jgi:hypothetical protein
VNFRTQKFRLDSSTNWFDYNSHSSGLKYDFACALQRPKIVLVKGPVPHGVQQESIFFSRREKIKKDLGKSALYYALPQGKRAIGDTGYEGVPEKVTITQGDQSRELKNFLDQAKNRQETLHTRLKLSNCLHRCFCHEKLTQNTMALHKMCVEAVCVIVQYDMDIISQIFYL